MSKKIPVYLNQIQITNIIVSLKSSFKNYPELIKDTVDMLQEKLDTFEGDEPGVYSNVEFPEDWKPCSLIANDKPDK